MQTNALRSYKNCWDYALLLCQEQNKSISELEIKNNIIEICGTTPEKFWVQFPELLLPLPAYKKICSFLTRYLRHDIPVPYLTKRVRFANLMFEIKSGVFVPQHDTEFLLEAVFDLFKQKLIKETAQVLEIGTGCGNIAICLAVKLPKWKITAVDINTTALKVTKKNSKLHNVRLNCVHSDLFSGLDVRQKFDLIVSNPPYVSAKEHVLLSPLTKQQPFNALVPPKGVVPFYCKLVKKAIDFISKNGFLVLEIDPKIHKKLECKLRLITSKTHKIGKIKIFTDFNDAPRVVVIRIEEKS